MSDEPNQTTNDLADLAIRSVLEQIPSAPTDELTDVQRQQPWAEKIAPQSTTGKRSLEELVDEYRERIAKDPEAKVHFPQMPSPTESYLQRFSRGAQQQGQPGRSRQRSRGGRRGSGVRGERPQGQPQAQAPQIPGQPGQAGPSKRRHRRRRRGPRTQPDAPAS